MTSELVDVFISGVSSSSVYAMIAIGISLVYGITKVFNLAYGSFFSLGGYLAWIFFCCKFGYPLVFVSVIPFLFLAGLATDKFIMRPLRTRKDWEMLVFMGTLGLCMFMDNLYLASFGPFVKSLPTLFEGNFNLGGFTVSIQDVSMFLIAIAIVIGLLLFLNRTRQGMAMRAVAQDMVGAEIVGIPKDRVFAYSLAIATVLAGVGGILLAPKYFVSFRGGLDILVKAWVITAVGGLGSLLGTIYAAFILGMVEALVAWQFGFTWVMVAWFAILIGLFTVRPQGLLGTWG